MRSSRSSHSQNSSTKHHQTDAAFGAAQSQYSQVATTNQLSHNNSAGAEDPGLGPVPGPGASSGPGLGPGPGLNSNHDPHSNSTWQVSNTTTGYSSLPVQPSPNAAALQVENTALKVRFMIGAVLRDRMSSIDAKLFVSKTENHTHIHANTGGTPCHEISVGAILYSFWTIASELIKW